MKKTTLDKNKIVPIVGELKFPDKLIAAPYIINDADIRRDWDFIHEKYAKENNLKFFINTSKPIATINNNIVYSIRVDKDVAEYIVFDNSVSTKASRYIFYLKLIKSKSRNGLFKTSANGWYPSRVWRSKNSKELGHRFILKMLDFVFDDLDADFIVSDFMQTRVFTERFKEFLLPRLSTDRIFVGLSFNKNYPICIPIESEQELILANSLISQGGSNKEYAYKSLFVLRSKYALSYAVTDKTVLVNFDDAIKNQLFRVSILDPELKIALDNNTLIA